MKRILDRRRRLLAAGLAVAGLTAAVVYIVVGEGDAGRDAGEKSAQADVPAGRSSPTESAMRASSGADPTRVSSADESAPDERPGSAGDQRGKTLAVPEAGVEGDDRACEDPSTDREVRECGSSSRVARGPDLDRDPGSPNGSEPPVTESTAPVSEEGSGDQRPGTSRQAIARSTRIEGRMSPENADQLSSPEAIAASEEAERSRGADDR